MCGSGASLKPYFSSFKEHVMTEFFAQLIETLENESRRRPGMKISPETLADLNASPEKEEIRIPVASAPGSSGNPAAAEHPPARPAPAVQAPPPPFVQQKAAENRAEASAPALVPGTLEHLTETVRHCRNCPLCETRLNAVPGEGNPHARLMFIGEGPGADEDRQGRPFVGAAGQLLDKMILAMQFRREDVYIANIVKCRPPRNRAPMPEEANACIGYLEHQIRMIKPEVIVLLGATAAHFLLQREEGIMRLRGRWLEYDGIPVMPTFHPAFLLRQESAKRDAWEDLKQVMRRLGIEPPAPRRRAQ